SDNLEFGENYTNTPEHNLKVQFGVLPRYNPDLVRFSCQQDGPWTNWRFYNYTQESQTYTFDLTDPLNGCQPTDRNVTVHAQIRDYANNTASQIATDWIVLDRNDPSATSIEPTNRYINLTDLVRINATDDTKLSIGLEAPNNTFNAPLFYEGWEDGDDDKWTTEYDCGWGVGKYSGYRIGTYSVRMGDGSSYVVRSMDISDVAAANITYYGNTTSMDSSGENGYLDWYDGSSWHNGLIEHHNDKFEKHTFNLPSSWIDADGNNKIRFRLAGSGCGDYFYVDEITVKPATNGTFIPNERFDPGYNYSFAESGSTQLTSWLYDRASNLALNTFDLFVDVRSPAVDQITTNASYIRPEKNISINVSDDQSFGFMRLNNGTETTQFTSTSVSYEPGWTQEIWKNLTLRMNDSAGNPTVRRYWYYIDGTPPTLDTISDSNTSYINDSILTVTAFDTRAGLGTLYQYNGNRNETFTSGNSFDADWSGEGTKPLTLFLFDKAGNLFKQYYEFTLDTTDPSASTNHSFPPPGAVNGWIGHDLAVGINATDNFQTDYIRYCTGASTCTPDKLSGQGLNVSTTVSCPSGSTCVKYVRFRANDSAGNNYPTPTSAATSDNVSIDKEVEEITFENPSDGGEATGVVDLRTFIDDSNGVGLQDANYSVVNKSNGVIYQSGDLNASKDWDAVWNSSEDVPVTHRVTFNVTAEDLLGNTRSENITFRVSNAGVTNTISQPAATYVTADFDLLVTAKRPGIPKLANHTYFIFNESTGSVVNYSQVTGLDTSEHAFNFTVDTGSWSNDGNYSINSTAFDNESERGIAGSWFYLDRVDPKADVAGITNKSWQRGIIDVGYTALDAVKNGSCYWRFNDEGSWSTNNSLSCGTGTFRFDTSNCNDDSTADCRLQVIAEDAAGNIKRDSVYLKVDNSPPNVSFVAPPKASWQNSDFDVKRNDEDSTVAQSLLTCQWRNGTGSWIDVSGSCDGNFSVDISTYCSQEGDTECEIEIRTRNPAGWTVKKTRLFSIDTRSPNVGSVDPLPSEEPVINGSRNFTVTFSDPTPGSGVQYAFRNNGTRKEALSSGVEFDPDWEDNGQETLSFALNDSADNLVTRSYTFDVDVSPPQFTGPRFNVSYDTSFNGYRIYPGQPITFKVNVTDNYEINTVTATLNTSSNGVDGKNITMSRTTGNTTDGVWEFEYTDTGSVGTYNVTALYLTDAVSNRNA
ncbi:MAG: hypothetical protein SV186_06065, partial [Candidatus Nanohaloarchaea archaeon]|nr:hypothetical protein [Candidatus Nanohaloarchaea archaeon]